MIAYNNVSLKCLVEIDPDDCTDMKFQWFFNNSSTPLTSGEKYDIQNRPTNTRCKKDFILTIANVTDDDEGKYKCQWICDEDYPSYLSTSFIQLNVTGIMFPLQDFSIGFSKFYYTLNDLMQLKMVFSKRKLERFSKTWISNKCDKKVN